MKLQKSAKKCKLKPIESKRQAEVICLQFPAFQTQPNHLQRANTEHRADLKQIASVETEKHSRQLKGLATIVLEVVTGCLKTL